MGGASFDSWFSADAGGVFPVILFLASLRPLSVLTVSAPGGGGGGGFGAGGIGASSSVFFVADRDLALAFSEEARVGFTGARLGLTFCSGGATIAAGACTLGQNPGIANLLFQ